MAKRYWLMKSEPTAYSIDDLKRDKSTLWEGVRNYQARNFMMKEMKVGDEALFYHSSAEPPGAVGIAEVSGPQNRTRRSSTPATATTIRKRRRPVRSGTACE